MASPIRRYLTLELLLPSEAPIPILSLQYVILPACMLSFIQTVAFHNYVLKHCTFHTAMTKIVHTSGPSPEHLITVGNFYFWASYNPEARKNYGLLYNLIKISCLYTNRSVTV